MAAPSRHHAHIEITERDEFEGGLRPPPGLGFWRRVWWWFDFLILVKIARLRFIGILVLIGVIITQWDTILNHYRKWTRPATGAEAGATDTEWFCPMHPSIVRDNPRDKCPICFMPLSKRKKGDAVVEALPAGISSRVQLSPYRVVLAGVKTWEVRMLPLANEITAVGYVEFNERNQRTVAARVAGRIDKLLANQTGQLVQAGDVLASLYSPELLVTAQSLLSAKNSNLQELLESSKTRLKLWGIDDAQIDEILRTGKADTHINIRSPITGNIIRKNVVEGQYVEEGMVLYDVADLASVWIQAQIYEEDLSILPSWKAGTAGAPDASGITISATTRSFPNERFEGKLAFVFPHLDQASRTVTVRFELDNPERKLRPGGTANVTLRVAPQERLAVPEGSVIDTGSQTVVYRESVPNVFEGVPVQLGPRLTGPDGVTFFPVLSGLAVGDRVVTSGSFLVDAETRLNPAAASIYFGGSGGTAASATTSVRATTPEDPEAKIRAGLARLSPADRELAEQQRFCVVLTKSRLGSMGVPVKIEIEGEPVFLCCQGCRPQALENAQAALAKARELRAATRRDGSKTPPVPDKPKPDAGPNTDPAGKKATAPTSATGEKKDAEKPAADPRDEADIAANLAKLSTADRKLALQQRCCAVENENRLGSMGIPIKVSVEGQPVFLCCEGCKPIVDQKPQKVLATAKRLREQYGSQAGKEAKP